MKLAITGNTIPFSRLQTAVWEAVFVMIPYAACNFFSAFGLKIPLFSIIRNAEAANTPFASACPPLPLFYRIKLAVYRLILLSNQGDFNKNQLTTRFSTEKYHTELAKTASDFPHTIYFLQMPYKTFNLWISIPHHTFDLPFYSFDFTARNFQYHHIKLADKLPEPLILKAPRVSKTIKQNKTKINNKEMIKHLMTHKM